MRKWGASKYLDNAPDYSIGAPDDSILFDYSNFAITLGWFKQVAINLDYDFQIKAVQAGAAVYGACPSAACVGTITLCGKCVGSDVPGNILFGFAAKAVGIPNRLRDAGAAWAEAWDWDG